VRVSKLFAKVDIRKIEIFVKVIKCSLHEIYIELMFNGGLALEERDSTGMPYGSYSLERNKFAQVGQKPVDISKCGYAKLFLSRVTLNVSYSKWLPRTSHLSCDTYCVYASSYGRPAASPLYPTLHGV